MIDLTGRVALVTGAGSGIGRATALMLGAAGARVALVERDAARLQAVAEEAGGRAIAVEPIAADVAARGAMDQAVARTLARWDALDVVVANAGISPYGSVLEMDEATWDEVLGVDLDGVFYTVRAAVPALKRSAHGRVICTASHYGLVGKETLAAYSAAKGGVIGFVRSLAHELGPHGITANAVAPGPIVTNIVQRTPEHVQSWTTRLPMRRLGQPDDVAGAILYLASDLATFVTGHVLVVDGGALLV